MKNKNIVSLLPIGLFALGLCWITAGILTGGCGGGGAGTTTGGGGGGGTHVLGHVVDYDSGLGIPNIQVLFYDAATHVVGNGVTLANGTYDIKVTAVPTKFTIVASTISVSYYRQYFYQAKWYAPSITTCTAPTPTITLNVNNNIPNVRFPSAAGPPPPPPTGCN